MENRIEDVYKKFGDKFCICPFLGGFYQSHGVVPKNQTTTVSTITPCSVTYWTHEHEFDLVDNSIEKSINSPVWKNMRRAFASGQYEQIPQCKICHDAERAGAHAARFGANQHFATNCHSANLVEEIQHIIDNDYHTDKLLSLDWFPSNYCNFSCVMCAGGASSSRLTYEIAITKIQQHIVQNDLAHDFHKFIDNVEVINFTGGETVMQKQVTDFIVSMAQQPSVSEKTIFLLTNASSYPEHLMSYFKKFYRVIYMCSIDGIGAVGEYQRRNSKWSEVETNSLKLLHHEFIGTVINFVLTAINALNFVDFADWVYYNKILNGIAISPVFRVEHLGVSALPPALIQLAIDRLDTALEKYQAMDDNVAARCVEILATARSIILSSKYSAQHHEKFIQHVQQEDKVSSKSLCDIVTEWQPYFGST